MIEFFLFVLAVAVIFVAARNGGRIGRLETEMRALQTELAALRAAPPAVERAPAEQIATVAADEDQPESTETIAASAPIESVAAVTEDGRHEETAALSQPEPAAALKHEQAEVAVEKPERESLESYLGARWAVWAGGLALALGGLFLVRYSIESGLLGPGVRLALAVLFGLALTAAGEALRRRALPRMTGFYANAMIPGVLTAAGAISVFGAIYAAHGIYGFIGPTPAFLLLALTAFATLGLSLLHGQGLAGVGLLGSMLTPLLVASNAPSPWTLFGFLTVSHVTTVLASRRQGWFAIPALANLGLGGWAVLYLSSIIDGQITPAVLALLAMLATAAFLWPARVFENEERGSDFSEIGIALAFGRKPVGIALSLALATILPALVLLTETGGTDVHPLYAVAALIAALGAIGASRHSMVWPAVLSAVGALAATAIQVEIVDSLISLIDNSLDGAVLIGSVDTTALAILLGLGAFFALAGFAFLARKGERDLVFAFLWAGVVATVPLAIGVLTYVAYGDFVRDWTHGLYGLLLGAALLAGAEWLARAGLRHSLSLALDLLVAGSFLAVLFGLEALTSELTLTLLIAITGFAYAMATRLRDWRALPWMMVLACLVVLGRIALEPTLVGPLDIGKTPLFNQLLPGYGIPALLAIASAYELRRWPSLRVRHTLQALGSLMGLLAVAVLLRHAMNGGALTGDVPTLGEQSIYTLLVIGMSGVLMTLDMRSPSPVFRHGAMLAGALSGLNVLALHLGALNPFFSGENTGAWPFVNLLLLGYLLPAIAYAGLAVYARGKRPQPYVAFLALMGSVLGFAWATLSVRRFWQGENVAEWKGFLQSETYSYSVVWLAIGVGLLVLGSRFDSKSIRLASAGLVMLSVAKAFLIDMSNLEGVLRALSFIGLGAVLIGIGLFYQKILTSRARPAAPELPTSAADGT